jgi:chitinase
MYDRSGLSKPSNLKHSKVTRYNFAFFQTNVNGDIWGTDDFADSIALYGEIRWDWVNGQGGTYCSWATAGKPPECKGHKYYGGLIYLAHSAGVEVYPSIGGWTLSDAFPAMAKNPTARLKFASNCAKLIETYDFDGIDIDWEYPGYADHMGTPEDTKSYSLMLQDIRIALDELGKKKGKVYGLTAALPCGPDHMKNIEIDVVSKVLSELNLMTYDLYG